MDDLKRQEMVEDLKVLKEFFAERSNATPVCLDYAIRSIEAWDKVIKEIDEKTIYHSDGEYYIRNIDATLIIHKHLKEMEK